MLLSSMIFIFFSCQKEKRSISEGRSESKESLSANITISRSSVDFTIREQLDTAFISLVFHKSKDSSRYHHVKFNSSFSRTYPWEKQLALIPKLWNIAQDSISFSLESMMVAYPLEHDQVLIDYIEAVQRSPEWEANNLQPIIDNYEAVRTVMLREKVYWPLDSILETFNYQLIGFQTEKHGQIPIADLRRLNYDTTLVIPIPYMVWIELSEMEQ